MKDVLTGLTGKRFLFVDDDEDIRFLVSRLMTKLEIPHDIAGSALEALGMFQPGLYDVAVLDMVMPDISGEKLGRLLRRRDPDIGLLFYTGIPEAVKIGDRTLSCSKGSNPIELIQCMAAVAG